MPPATDGALQVQMSFPPMFPHAENVCRVPAYLPHVLSLGEHRGSGGDTEVIKIGDLAITATRDRLHLVSVSRRRHTSASGAGSSPPYGSSTSAAA